MDGNVTGPTDDHTTMTKTAEDLDDSHGSIGGAMSRWPLRTIEWGCRELRSESYNPEVIEALLASEVETLEGLQSKAIKNNIGIEQLTAQTDALRWTSADDLATAIQREYNRMYQEGSLPGEMGACPFQDSGMDKSCWQCPLSGRVMDRLVEGQ
jgi:hypothetical protein